MCTSTAPHSDTQLHLTHRSIDFLRNHQRKRHHQGARREHRNVLSLTPAQYIHHLHMGRLVELQRPHRLNDEINLKVITMSGVIQ